MEKNEEGDPSEEEEKDSKLGEKVNTEGELEISTDHKPSTSSGLSPAKQRSMEWKRGWKRSTSQEW